MARPTNEKKDKTVKLRISEDLYDELVKKDTNLSETIRKILKNAVFSVPQNLKNGKMPKNSVPQNEISTETRSAIADIEEMALCSGLTLEKLTTEFCEMLNEGKLMVENGKLVAEKEKWAEKFEEACHDLCIPVEKAAESAIKGLKK